MSEKMNDDITLIAALVNGDRWLNADACAVYLGMVTPTGKPNRRGFLERLSFVPLGNGKTQVNPVAERRSALSFRSSPNMHNQVAAVRWLTQGYCMTAKYLIVLAGLFCFGVGISSAMAGGMTSCESMCLEKYQGCGTKCAAYFEACLDRCDQAK